MEHEGAHAEEAVQPKWEYILLYIIPIGTIWGNIFVCLAVYLEHRLRHRFNLFLVSLAVSDLMCALLVMPVSAWQLIRDKPTDRTLCLVWYSLDIFFTATTIIHLCSISLDRYLALRQPFGQVQSKRKLAISLGLRITMSWLIPFCIAGPLFLFALWQREKEYERIRLEMTATSSPPPNTSSTVSPSTTSDNVTSVDQQLPASYKGCGPNDQTFVLTAIGVTFVLPLAIITATYLLTVQTLRHHITQVKAIKLYSTPSSSRRLVASSPGPTMAAIHKQTTLNYLKRSCSARTPGQSNAGSSSNNERGNNNNNNNSKRRNASDTDEPLHEAREKQTANDKEQEHMHTSERSTKQAYQEKCSPTPILPIVTIDEGSLPVNNHEQPGGQDARQVNTSTHKSETHQDNSNTSVDEQSLFKPILDTGDIKIEPGTVVKRDKHDGYKLRGATSNWSMDRIHRSKRAVRVIGGLFGLFVVCYLPFFIVYIIDVVCVSCQSWTTKVIPHLEWLGYLSSMLNPVVYHSFNATFRRTFRRLLLTCACRSQHEHQAVWRRTAEV